MSTIAKLDPRITTSKVRANEFFAMLNILGDDEISRLEKMCENMKKQALGGHRRDTNTTEGSRSSVTVVGQEQVHTLKL